MYHNPLINKNNIIKSNYSNSQTLIFLQLKAYNLINYHFSNCKAQILTLHILAKRGFDS
jgi:hypothetical protein